MATLLRGTQPEADPNVKPAPNIGPPTTDLPDRRTPRTLRVSLVIADVLLMALVIRLVTKTPGRLGLIEVALCIIALGLGAWLTCLAIWRD